MNGKRDIIPRCRHTFCAIAAVSGIRRPNAISPSINHMCQAQVRGGHGRFREAIHITREAQVDRSSLRNTFLPNSAICLHGQT